MTSQDLGDLVRSAERLYAQEFREQLEQPHADEFIAIEPISGDYFLGRTLSEAQGAAYDAHPDRLSHAIRIGHKTALHLASSYDKRICRLGWARAD